MRKKREFLKLSVQTILHSYNGMVKRENSILCLVNTLINAAFGLGLADLQTILKLLDNFILFS